MIALIVTAVVLGYLVCSVLGFGLTVGYFQQEFYKVRSKNVYSLAWLIAFMGPIGLTIAFLAGSFGKHGLQFRATTSDYMRKQGCD